MATATRTSTNTRMRTIAHTHERPGGSSGWRRRSSPGTTHMPGRTAHGSPSEGSSRSTWSSAPGAGKTTLLEATLRPPEGPEVRLGHRRGSGDRARRRAHPRGRRPCAPAQHGDRVPPRRALRRPRARGPGSSARLHRHHRERRKPRLPRAVRPGRARQDSDPVGHRGRGQAAQVPAHVPGERRPRPQQGGPACRTFGSTWTAASPTRAASTPSSASSVSRPTTGQGLDAWCSWLLDQVEGARDR